MTESNTADLLLAISLRSEPLRNGVNATGTMFTFPRGNDKGWKGSIGFKGGFSISAEGGQSGNVTVQSREANTISAYLLSPLPDMWREAAMAMEQWNEAGSKTYYGITASLCTGVPKDSEIKPILVYRETLHDGVVDLQDTVTSWLPDLSHSSKISSGMKQWKSKQKPYLTAKGIVGEELRTQPLRHLDELSASFNSACAETESNVESTVESKAESTVEISKSKAKSKAKSKKK